MNDIIQIGPLNLYIPLLFYIGAIFLSALVGHLVFKQASSQPISKKPADVILEYWFIFIIVWKLSYFFKYPADLIENPITILYFDGGYLGLILGIIALILYSIRQYHYFQIPFQWQIAWFLLAVIILISIEQMITLIYGFSFNVIVELIAYTVIIILYFFNSPQLSWIRLLGASRWVAVIWIAFRLLENAADSRIVEIILALVLAVMTYIIEWIIESRKKRGGFHT